VPEAAVRGSRALEQTSRTGHGPPPDRENVAAPVRPAHHRRDVRHVHPPQWPGGRDRGVSGPARSGAGTREDRGEHVAAGAAFPKRSAARRCRRTWSSVASHLHEKALPREARQHRRQGGRGQIRKFFAGGHARAAVGARRRRRSSNWSTIPRRPAGAPLTVKRLCATGWRELTRARLLHAASGASQH
jgi:hypothetical protein